MSREPMISTWTQNLADEEGEGFTPARGWHPATRSRPLAYRRGAIWVGRSPRKLLNFHWDVLVRRDWRQWEFGWKFETETYGERDYGVDLHIGPLTIYTEVSSSLLPKPKPTEWALVGRFTETALPDIVVHYAFGYHSWSEATGRIPRNRRRSGLFWLMDSAFGRFDYHEAVLDEYDAVIPLPERGYNVKVQIIEGRRKRPRWPWAHREVHARVDCKDDPLPTPGNMDSDFWNGEDAIFSTGTKAGTRAEVVGDVVKHVLAERLRHGGSIDWKPKGRVGA